MAFAFVLFFFYSISIILNFLYFGLWWDMTMEKHKMCYDELIKYIRIGCFKKMWWFL